MEFSTNYNSTGYFSQTIMTTSIDYQYANRTIYNIKSDALRYTWAGYYLFIIASSFIGNTAILIASVKYRAVKLHRVIVIIIHHIAICDLMVTFTNALPKFVSVLCTEWVFGKFLCTLTAYMSYYCEQSTILLICIITSTKLLMLKYPLRFGAVSKKKAHWCCVLCWLIALILPAAFLLIAVLDEQEIYFSYRRYHCNYEFKSEIWHWLRPFLAVTFIFTPNCVVVATTVCLLIKAKQTVRRARESLKWQGIVTTVLIATVYCISFLPYAVYLIGTSRVTNDPHSFFHLSFFRIAISFLFLNTISNFYIYSLSVQSFRHFLRLAIRSRVQQTYRIFSSIGTTIGQGREYMDCCIYM